MNNPIFSNHFQAVVKQIAAFFPSGLPAMTPEDWAALHALEDRINELWKADSATFNEFKEAVGKYKMFWFNKRNGGNK